MAKDKKKKKDRQSPADSQKSNTTERAATDGDTLGGSNSGLIREYTSDNVDAVDNPISSVLPEVI